MSSPLTPAISVDTVDNSVIRNSIVIATNGDATLKGALTENSDVNAKQDIEAIDNGAILEKVVALPIREWSYKDAPDTRHLGSMAQDFRAAFGLGNTDTGIATLDSSGVALAAIQALNQKLVAQNHSMAEQNQSLVQRVYELEQRTGLRNWLCYW